MLVMALSLTIMPVMVLAQDATEISDSLDESVSGFKIGLKQLGLAFTFNQEKKIDKELDIARLRLIQAKVAAENGNTGAVQKALEAHNRLLEKVHARVNIIDGKSDENAIRASLSNMVALEKAIEVHEARIAKFNEILGSGNLTDEQMAKIESRLELMQNKTDDLKQLQEQKQERVKTRLMAVTEMTEEEADAEIQNLENAQNLGEVRKVVAEVRLQAAEKALEKLKARVSVTEANGNNVSAILARIANAEQRVSEAKSFSERIRAEEGNGNQARTETDGNYDSGSDNSGSSSSESSGNSNSGSGNSGNN
ncbi:hypothetical protein COV15_02365 [Candidatus Woesearchaeota archaeon CG10_big_fil_rev_8_21_14_0_10_34_12]|nr:MAG: hypothetical protein COV15_02365 [Candidatus Woesearchaeota archaeon CG10_big_fil_rev_8_21_14_0_10_34_12]